MLLSTYAKKVLGIKTLEDFKRYEESFNNTVDTLVKYYREEYLKQYSENSGIFAKMGACPDDDLAIITLNELKRVFEIKDYDGDGMLYYRL